VVGTAWPSTERKTDGGNKDEKYAELQKQLETETKFYEEALEARTEQLEELETQNDQKTSELKQAQDHI